MVNFENFSPLPYLLFTILLENCLVNVIRWILNLNLAGAFCRRNQEAPSQRNKHNRRYVQFNYFYEQDVREYFFIFKWEEYFKYEVNMDKK